MKKLHPTKLRLKKETLQALGSRELAAVHGGKIQFDDTQMLSALGYSWCKNC